MGLRQKALFVGLACAALAPASSIAAVYAINENFDSYDPYNASPLLDVTPTGFAEYFPSTTGTVTRSVRIQPDSPSGRDYEFAVSGTRSGTTSGAAAVASTTHLPTVPGRNFTITTEMQLDTLNTISGASANVGIILLAANSDASTSSANAYRFVLYTAGADLGKFGLLEAGNAIGTPTSPALRTSNGTLYTITINGSYDKLGDASSALTIAGTVSDGATTTTFSYLDSTPQTGSYFGLRNAVSTGNNAGTLTVNVDFDNFAVSIPEPTALLTTLSAASSALLLRRRPRK